MSGSTKTTGPATSLTARSRSGWGRSVDGGDRPVVRRGHGDGFVDSHRGGAPSSADGTAPPQSGTASSMPAESRGESKTSSLTVASEAKPSTVIATAVVTSTLISIQQTAISGGNDTTRSSGPDAATGGGGGNANDSNRIDPTYFYVIGTIAICVLGIAVSVHVLRKWCLPKSAAFKSRRFGTLRSRGGGGGGGSTGTGGGGPGGSTSSTRKSARSESVERLPTAAATAASSLHRTLDSSYLRDLEHGGGGGGSSGHPTLASIPKVPTLPRPEHLSYSALSTMGRDGDGGVGGGGGGGGGGASAAGDPAAAAYYMPYSGPFAMVPPVPVFAPHPGAPTAAAVDPWYGLAPGMPHQPPGDVQGYAGY
ncbi:hypothetical protein DFJ73DRAFT_799734 [Zopfochytrium polystomum]|nr:hypothetical protein DFJ73DRAFT_799734 [Zopfochytrium polystomum]